MSALAGKRALVTGASRGIGLAIAQRLGRAGAHVILSARESTSLHRAASTLERASVETCDLGSEEDIRRLASAVDSHGHGVDILVNAAGSFALARIGSSSASQYHDLLRVNAAGPARLIDLLLPGMRSRGHGHIVSIGSVADRAAFPANGAYAASKFALRGFHEVLREELRGSGIRSTLVSPAATDTTLWQSVDRSVHTNLPSREAMLHESDVADAVMWVLTQPAHVNIDELRLSRA